MATIGEQFADKFGLDKKKFESNSKPSNNQRNSNQNTEVRFRLPDGYLSDGYYNSDGVLKKELVLSLAKKFGDEFSRKNEKNKVLTSYNKLRGFFDGVVEIRDAISNGYYSPEEGQVRIAQLLARVYKRCSTNTVSISFRDFMQANIEYICDLEDKEDIRLAIDAFAKHYEAIVGFTAESNS